MKTSILSGFIICLLLLAGSCNKVPTNPYKAEQQKVLLNRGRLVGDLASPANMHMAKIEGVALVEGLMGTGADEPPSTYQQMVYQELQKDPDRKSKAKHLIASMSTAIVLLEASIPPAAQAGDRLDVDVRLLPQSEATSLAGGYVENVPMHQYMAIDIIRKGSRLGVANGYVLLDPDLIERESPVAYKKGKIIGGVVLTKSRPLWLQLRDGEQSAGVASRIEDVINKRFNYKKAGYAGKRKVAEAKAGAVRINLVVPEEYKDNINRYVNVVCAISFFETEDELNDRITDLGVRLLNPEKSEAASLELEAIGSGNARVVDILTSGMNSSEEIVRFNSAIAVAYLNIRGARNQAITILADLARNSQKLRPASLAVLGTCMKSSFEADEQLRQMLSVNSNETRYGAFRALWTRNPKDYMIQGENLADQFSYHCLNCGGPPLVHVTQSKRPEIVLFSKDNIFLQGQFMIDASSQITVRSDGSDVIVKKYQSDDGIDEQRRVGYKVDEIIRAIVDIGGTYPEVVRMLIEAKKQKVLVAYNEEQKLQTCSLVFDALPGKNTGFKRIREIENLAMRELAEEEQVKKENHKNMWNPKNWFAKKEESENLEEFSDEEIGFDGDDESVNVPKRDE